jgi:uncharacterized membrane protein
VTSGVALSPEVGPATTPPSDTPVDSEPPNRQWFLLRVTGAVVLGVWLIGLGAYSTTIYHRGFLAEDFATYNQAWTLIGRGHLNPYDTVFHSYSFLKSDFELIIWPLALVHLVFPQPIALLWIQDLAVAGSGLVAYLWIVDYLERRRLARWPSVGVAAVVLTVLVANPGAYQTLSFDFHLEPISTFFVLLAGRDLWLGRHRRAWIWVGVVLLCGSFAAITLVGLGISALLAGRATRRQGAVLIVVAVAWLALISAVGANLGSDIGLYAYLAGRSSLPGSGGIVVLAGGMIAHPSRVIHQIHARLPNMYVLVKQVGVIGLASAWGFGVPVVVMVTNALNSNSGLINQAFQNAAVFPFVLLGTVMVLVRLAQRFRYGWVPSLVIAVAVSIQALAYGIPLAPANVRWGVSQIGPGPAAQLRKALALTPPQAETITTISIMGRFCARTYCYWFYPDGTLPVHSHQVVFVFDPANESAIPPSSPTADLGASAFVRDDLHARVLVDADGITAFEWLPPPGTTHVTVSTAP